jgi:hypothetical protein
MISNNDRVNIATVTTMAVIKKGADRIEAIDAVAHKAKLTDTETAQVVRDVNKLLRL